MEYAPNDVLKYTPLHSYMQYIPYHCFFSVASQNVKCPNVSRKEEGLPTVCRANNKIFALISLHIFIGG